MSTKRISDSSDRELESRGVQIEIASQQLAQIAFPALSRPRPSPDGEPSRELVNWSIRLYCYSILAHFREMLSSYLLLADRRHVPATFVICRCLYEVGAHVYYVHKHVRQYLAKGKFGAAWELLREVNMGSLYMRETPSNQESEGGLVEPRRIQKVIRCFDEWKSGGDRARAEYSFLSEFAHPNMAAFQHYYEQTRSPESTFQAKFGDGYRRGPVPDVSKSLKATLEFAGKLLAASGEAEVSERVRSILNDFCRHG